MIRAIDPQAASTGAPCACAHHDAPCPCKANSYTPSSDRLSVADMQRIAAEYDARQQPGHLGALPDFISNLGGNWQTIALIAAVALALYLLLQSSPAKQERNVELRKARARYRAQQNKIRAEFA